MARPAKAGARHDQDPFFHRLLDELDIILFGAVGEEEEGASRLDEAETQLSEVLGEGRPVLFVLAEIDGDMLAIGDGQLKQAGSVDEPKRAITEGASCDQIREIGGSGMHGEVADSITRQAQVLGVGSDDDRVVIAVGDLRAFQTVVGDLSVGFIADQVDGVADALRCDPQCIAELLQLGLTVDTACRIVRAVDDDSLGSTGDLRQQFLRIRAEIFGCRAVDRNPAVVLDVEQVLDKVRAEDNYLVAGIEQGLEDDVECPPRTDSHHDVGSGPWQFCSLHEVHCDLVSDLRPARVWHVAVYSLLRSVNKFSKSIDKLGGWRQMWIAEGEIEDAVLAMDALETIALLEHLADPR